MVVIEIEKNDLLKLIGKEITDEEIENTLFGLKCEATIEDNKITCELNPDRLDMISVEGIARAIKAYLGLSVKNYEPGESSIVVKGESLVRPAFSAAVVEGVTMTDDFVASLMQIQEKLHMTIGRDRAKVAIGVHDLDKVKSPIEYKDVNYDEVTFVPLQDTRMMNLKQILEDHPKGKGYVHLLNDRYPVFVDKEGVMSFPPIINSERTKVTEKTKNLFIDVTGTDQKAVDYALSILVCNISERVGMIKKVKINRESVPKLEERSLAVTKYDVNLMLGIELDDEQIKRCLEKMLHRVTIKGNKITAHIPSYRTDILHPVDLIEDIAMGYGFENIEPVLPDLATVGSLSEREKYSRKVRELMVGFGFQEFMNFVLTSKENNFDKMNTRGEMIEILNPISSEYAACRTWLLPSLMKVLASNLHIEFPQRIFEVGDVIHADASQARKLAGVVSNDNANLTEIKSLVESILTNMSLKYEIRSLKHHSFIDTRCGEISVNGKVIGFFGEVHPMVLEKWKLEHPVIAFEINLEGLYG